MQLIDLFIIGGGINGAAIAADAAGRGLSVTLCEKNDLASGTSSASTKLIHGGLRYLEFYEFNLVRKALREREVLMRRAPNLIKPLEFRLPYEKHLRSPWLIRLGLFLYDHLSKRHFLPSSKTIDFSKSDSALTSEFKKGFSYYDCFTDDARLVILNALSAKENGGEILTHTQFINAKIENNHWKIELLNTHTGSTQFYFAKALVNAGGPWVCDINKNIFNAQANPVNEDCLVNLVKGSHIVVPKLYEGDFAYILECRDKRIIFTIPYQEKFTLIGTTDVAATHLENISIDEKEIKYLCNVVNHYFRKKIHPTDIVWSYAGVRCLQAQHTKKFSKMTRDYSLILTSQPAPLISVIGGKLTTHRLLAEDVLKKCQPFFPNMGAAWTANKPLPGYEFDSVSPEDFIIQFSHEHPWLPEFIARRYATNYGKRAYQLLDGAKSLADLGEAFAGGLYEKEVKFLINQEWAQSVEDILWRRTKLGLFFTEEDVKKLEISLRRGL